MKGKKRVEFVIYGLHPALFCSEVDQYFLCPVCYFVASSPVMCKICEQIYCEGCIERYRKIKDNQCRSCKSHLDVIPLRKFPRKVYESFFLYCPYFNNGCRFEGGINEIHEHKENCEFKKIHCLNPLCAHNFLAKERIIPDADVCSEQCLETFQLYEMLGKTTRVEVSKFFWRCVQNHKKTFTNKIEEDYENLVETEDDTKMAWDNEIRELEEKYEDFRWHVHSGKFLNEVWTCCQQPKDQIGCSVLQK